MTSTFRPTPTSEVDYLDEDKPLRGQNYVCLSFLSPEEILANKEVFLVERYITQLSKELGGLLDGLSTKFPESLDMINGLREMNSHFLKGGDDLQEAFRVFKGVHGAELESEFHEKNEFRTSIRGIKVRGVFETQKEAQVRAEVLKKMGDKFDIFVGQVGCWCPWSPNPHEMADQQYTESHLNELMHQYQDNMQLRDQVFDQRKTDKIREATEKVAADKAAKAAAAEAETEAGGDAGAGTSAAAELAAPAAELAAPTEGDAVMEAPDAWRPRE